MKEVKIKIGERNEVTYELDDRVSQKQLEKSFKGMVIFANKDAKKDGSLVKKIAQSVRDSRAANMPR